MSNYYYNIPDLHKALLNNDAKLAVSLIYVEKVDVNEKDNQNRLPIQLTLDYIKDDNDQYDIIKHLVLAGADMYDVRKEKRESVAWIELKKEYDIYFFDVLNETYNKSNN